MGPKVRDQLDAYVVIALGSCAHVVVLNQAGSGTHHHQQRRFDKFEGCSVLHATGTELT